MRLSPYTSRHAGRVESNFLVRRNHAKERCQWWRACTNLTVSAAVTLVAPNGVVTGMIPNQPARNLIGLGNPALETAKDGFSRGTPFHCPMSCPKRTKVVLLAVADGGQYTIGAPAEWESYAGA